MPIGEDLTGRRADLVDNPINNADGNADSRQKGKNEHRQENESEQAHVTDLTTRSTKARVIPV